MYALFKKKEYFIILPAYSTISTIAPLRLVRILLGKLGNKTIDE
jgi:hypothetical protein